MNRKRPYKCTDCNTTFFKAENMRVHMKQVHDKNTERHQCDLCEAGMSIAWDWVSWTS